MSNGAFFDVVERAADMIVFLMHCSATDTALYMIEVIEYKYSLDLYIIEQ